MQLQAVHVYAEQLYAPEQNPPSQTFHIPVPVAGFVLPPPVAAFQPPGAKFGFPPVAGFVKLPVRGFHASTLDALQNLFPVTSQVFHAEQGRVKFLVFQAIQFLGSGAFLH